MQFSHEEYEEKTNPHPLSPKNMWREICNKTNLDAKFYIQTSRKVDFYPRLYRILPNPWQHLDISSDVICSSELWSTGCYNVLQQIHKSCSIVWMVCCSLMQIGGEMVKDLETSKRLWGFALLKLRSTAFVVQMLAIWLRENETFCGWNWCKSCWGALPCRHGAIEGYFMFCCHVLQHTNMLQAR